MRNARSGSLLIVAVVAVSVVTMVALSLAGRLRAEAAAAEESRYRRETRQACRNAVMLMAAERLVADTNGWDALTETWAEPWERRAEEWVLRVSGEGWQARADRTAGLRDEAGRIPLCADAAPLLAALLEGAAGLSGETAAGLAQRIAQGGPYVCPAQLAAVPGLTPEAFAAILPCVTPFPSSRVNINTAPEPVLAAVFASAGLHDEAAARTLILRIRAFRAAGNHFTSAAPQAVARSLGGLPSDERLILAYCQEHLDVASDIFSGVAEATPARYWEEGRAPGRARFTYDRRARVFLRWIEE